MGFRGDINGLRACAVVAVMLYHFDVALFSGGFAGVDVFFVISGFLMTGIILEQLRENRFSFGAFYLARGLRIVPAVTVLCAALLAWGWFWLIPYDYAVLGKHTGSSMGFFSNFVYWDEDGYFDAPSRDKWLLHTWSLAVEWQFYLLFPLLLAAVQKFFTPTLKTWKLIFWGMAAVSLGLSVALMAPSSPVTFYLLPARVWQFVAGGLVWLYVQDASVPQARARLLEGAGLAMILAAFVFIDSYVPWPGYGALLPVLGTVFVILAARASSPLTSNVVAHWLGKWSYSIYLWHWPIVVGLGYFGVTDTAWLVAGMVVSVLLGAASYAWVETPLRLKKSVWSRKKSVSILILMVLAIGGAGYAIDAADGIHARVPATVSEVENLVNDRYSVRPGCTFNKKTQEVGTCILGDENNIRFALLGDSHSYAVMDVVLRASKAGGVAYGFGCPTIFNTLVKARGKDHPCKEFNDLAFAHISSLPKDVPVIIVNRFSYYLHGFNEGIRKNVGLEYLDVPPEDFKNGETPVFQRELTKSLCRYAAQRKTYVLKPVAEMGQDVPKTLARSLMIKNAVPDISVSKESYTRRHADILSALDDAHQSCGVILLDPWPYLCEQNICPALHDGRPLYFDDDHLSLWGSGFLEPLFAEVFTGD